MDLGAYCTYKSLRQGTLELMWLGDSICLVVEMKQRSILATTADD